MVFLLLRGLWNGERNSSAGIVAAGVQPPAQAHWTGPTTDYTPGIGLARTDPPTRWLVRSPDAEKAVRAPYRMIE